MMRSRWAFALAAVALAAPLQRGVAQIPNPVYADVSPSARDALVRASEMASGGNVVEAARELQKLLDQHADRVVPSADDPDLFHSVRSRVHRALLSSPELLVQYLSAEGARAAEQLAAGSLEAARRVEAARFLTDAGFEAALRVAQSQLEAACFEAARLTLEPLEDHPLRRKPEGRESARAAARLLAMVARYLGEPRPEVLSRAQRWATDAGIEPPNAPLAEAPATATARTFDVLGVGAPLDPAGVPSQPLWSAPIEPPSAAEVAGPLGDPRQGVPPKDPTSLWVLPTIVGDTLYLNDGTWLTARDRFTLQLRWAIEPGRDQQDEETRFAARAQGAMVGAGRAVEDNNSVTVSGGLVVATTGLARDGSREGDPRTHALDAATGEVLWSVHVPGLDPQLESGSVRGPALVDGDTVVVMVRKSALARRIVSVYLVGLALRTGELRWSRLIASAGALPFNRERRITDIHALDRGVAYVCDQLGAAGAVEAATGRPVWVRRVPVAGIAETSLPWRFGSPVPVGPSVFLLSPDHRELLRVEAHSGLVTGRRSTGVLADPDYLLSVGEHLAAVGESRVALLPMADIAQGQVRLTGPIPDPGIRGRVVVAEDRLLVPRADAVQVVSPARPSEESLAPLSAMGTLLPIPNQLLAVDSRDISSYLAWPVAQQLLQERMTAEPGNPEPATTYAELAFRAGQPSEVAPAADKALEAIQQDPARHGPARAKLFDSLRQMVEASQERWRGGGAAGPVLDHGALAAVIERLGRAASGAEDRLSHLMALGRLREAEGSPALAVEAYQRILNDAVLAQATWKGPGVRVRADAEASSRVRRIVLEQGAESYAAFDAEAAAVAAGLAPASPADAIESILRRYPAAGQNAALWLRVSELRDRAGAAPDALDALREGLAAADLSRRAGRVPDAAVEGELAGRLLNRLSAADQVFAASRLLSSIRADRPGLALLDRGTPIATDRLAANLAGRLTRLERLPRVGAELGPDTQALQGWSIVRPVLRERVATPTEHILLQSVRESRVGLWGISAGHAAADAAAPGTTGPEHLSLLWARPYTGAPPRLLRIDPESVALLWDHREQGVSVEWIDTVTGQTRWRSEPLRSLLAGDPEHDRRLPFEGERIDTPLDPGCEARDVLVASDGAVIAVAERIGRVAVFDVETGRVLWKGVSEAWRVHDLDVGNGMVVIAGAVPPGGDPRAGGETPAVYVHEARTGRLVRRLDQFDTPVRWVRLVPPAVVPTPGLVIALLSEIIAVDPHSGARSWDIPGGPAFESNDAWVFGERLLVLDGSRDLWLVSMASGRVGDGPLDTLSRLTDAWPVEAVPMPPPTPDADPHVAFLTSRGVVVFDLGAPGSPPAGRLVGIDALARDAGIGVLDPTTGAGAPLVAPVMARDRIFTVETWSARLADGRPAYTLHLLDSASGRLQGTAHQLVLWEPPHDMALLDGRLLITAGGTGGVTLVYSAPAGP